MNRKIGRNDLCWCNSGRKYKHCHLAREWEKRLPHEALTSAARHKWKHSVCLHQAASEDRCGKIISAHTLQRSRVLKDIADDNNKILTFYPRKLGMNGQLQLRKTGWRQASTFEAFCDKHDTEAFAPLETVRFSGGKEQIFLIAYRAICWELFQKICAKKALPAVMNLADRGRDGEAQFLIQQRLNSLKSGLDKGHENLLQLKNDMDKSFVTKDYGGYNTYEIVVEGPLGVAAIGAVTPNRSIAGEILQILHDANSVNQWLPFGVDVSERGVSIVFLWRKSESAPSRYMREIDAMSDLELPGFLIQFIFAHCENTYFSSAWWESLTQLDKQTITKLAMNPNPYYELPKFDLTRTLGMGRLLSRLKSED